ncbi:hypothetical protein LOZ53_002881 [Ophidiomyces ophidiicola]|nr:hypothetical protein LOZ55_000270 [Ophidiomyces ophidiicola]KAI1989656.1 hypothetical protein LOZ54_002798 [Ophidiomyces ophidiicola]KAI1991445.1 hypothetical protein LOZ53_002881 [Ophidiomyces ophidiicola]KAI2003596.1 hypothetical protein LOZ51_000678 [Ophidiomyces ophidiicola]
MRTLPAKNNPMIQPDASPSHEELLSRRRLGSTNLTVKPDHFNTSNATRPENLGVFEYAHLRAPLPKNLKGSEIFSQSTPNPDTYFLMRRSKDGYVSATGMFKIAFPWAKHAEEKSEREYLRTRSETSSDEIAGNLWISPSLALELAEEYKMYNWVRALLDPTDIPQNPTKSPTKSERLITAPPKFDVSKIDSSTFAPPPSTTRSRTLRSASPSKPSAKLKATPRKKTTRTMKEHGTPSALAASESLQSSLDAVTDAASAIEKEDIQDETDQAEINGGEEHSDPEGEETPVKNSTDHVKINVQSETTVDTTEDLETSRTTVTVEMPNGLPELPLPHDTEEMIAKAKEMVEEAAKLHEDGEETVVSSKLSRKRKVDETADGTEGADAEVMPTQPAKKARFLEARLRRERVRNRALIGVTATLAIVATIPYFF